MHLTRALKFGGGVHYFNYSDIERFNFFLRKQMSAALTKNPSKSNDQIRDKLFLDAAGCPFEFTHKLGKYFSSGQRKPWIHKSNGQPLLPYSLLNQSF